MIPTTSQRREAGLFFAAMILSWCSTAFALEDPGTVSAAVDDHMHAAGKYRALKASSEVEMMKCSKPVILYDSAPPQEDEKYNCNYQHPLAQAYSCGEIAIPYDADPWVWECHLKDRVFSRITQHDLRMCAFGALDIGANNGDWILGIGAYAPNSRYAAVEAGPYIYQRMFQNFATNAGLVERVYGYNAAAGSPNAYSAHQGPLFAETGAWTGPTMCVPSSDKSLLDQTVGKGTNCPQNEEPIPIITPDSIMKDFSPMIKSGAGLFFVKIDIEGGEYQALLGMREVFSNPETRPCYVYVELKNTPEYEKALKLLTDEYGYPHFTDLDSGVHGIGSFPPEGTRWKNEGNYEFWLPEAEHMACAERVRKATCGQ